MESLPFLFLKKDKFIFWYTFHKFSVNFYYKVYIYIYIYLVYKIYFDFELKSAHIKSSSSDMKSP